MKATQKEESFYQVMHQEGEHLLVHPPKSEVMGKMSSLLYYT